MRKSLLIILLFFTLFVAGCGKIGNGAFRNYEPIYVPTNTYSYYPYESPKSYTYTPEQRTSMLDEWNMQQEKNRLERRLRKLERFQGDLMDRNSYDGRSLLTGRRPSYGESLLK